jgi:hypothetical protein
MPLRAYNSIPRGVLAGRVIQIADQGKDLLQGDIHNRLWL